MTAAAQQRRFSRYGRPCGPRRSAVCRSTAAALRSPATYTRGRSIDFRTRLRYPQSAKFVKGRCRLAVVRPVSRERKNRSFPGFGRTRKRPRGRPAKNETRLRSPLVFVWNAREKKFHVKEFEIEKTRIISCRAFLVFFFFFSTD